MIDEKKLETTPVQHIRNLMESIEEGMLTVTYYDPIEPTYSLAYEVSCMAADVEEVVSKYETLVCALEAIGVAREKIDNGGNPKDVLNAEQYAIWDTYIRDFDESFDSGEYDPEVLCDMRACGAPLNDEEQEILEQYHEWFEAQCMKRLPQKVYSPMLLVNRARRYEYLISHNAPKKVLDEEGRWLAEEMILYHYSV